MSKRRNGIDIMQHKVHELMPKIEDWRKAKEAEERQQLGEVVHKFPDGWTIRQLQNEQEMMDEGQQMGHCVGTEEHGCPRRHEEDHSVFASLRDPHNLPHATIELSPAGSEVKPENSGWNEYKTYVPRAGQGSRTHQFYGKEDAPPLPEYQNRVNEWLGHIGAEEAVPGGSGPEDWEEEPAEAGIAHIEPADSVEAFNRIHGDGEWHEYISDTDNGEDVGEMTEPSYSEPEWQYLAEDYLTGIAPQEYMPRPHDNQQRMEIDESNLFGYRGGPGVQARENFLHTLSDDSYNREQFEDALKWGHDAEDPREVKLVNHYHETMERLQREREQAQREQQIRNPHEMYFDIPGYPKPMFTPNPALQEWNFELQRNERRKEETPQWKEWLENHYPVNEDQLSMMPGVPQPPRYYQMHGPEPNPYQYHAKTAARTRPLYYRWVYSPSKGVSLGTNQDDHPALVKYHRDLGGDINDTDLIHGYASALDGGWRITDLEHRPVEDPYIVQQVVRRLNHEDAPQIRSEGSWRPSEFDWERIHYGLPCEKFVS
jgi:hypothetical protein